MPTNEINRHYTVYLRNQLTTELFSCSPASPCWPSRTGSVCPRHCPPGTRADPAREQLATFFSGSAPTSPLPHRVPPSKQNLPPSTAPYRRRSTRSQVCSGAGGQPAVREKREFCRCSWQGPAASRDLRGTCTRCTGSWWPASNCPASRTWTFQSQFRHTVHYGDLPPDEGLAARQRQQHHPSPEHLYTVL